MTVQCSYLSGSIVRGLLTIAHSPTHTSYHVAHRNDTESVTQFSISGLSGEEYLIAVFDLDNAGLPEPLPAATLTPVTTNNTTTPSHSEDTGYCVYHAIVPLSVVYRKWISTHIRLIGGVG